LVPNLELINLPTSRGIPNIWGSNKESRNAKLAAGAASTLAVYLFETHEEAE
jgi:hypothetical protein